MSCICAIVWISKTIDLWLLILVVITGFGCWNHETWRCYGFISTHHTVGNSCGELYWILSLGLFHSYNFHQSQWPTLYIQHWEDGCYSSGWGCHGLVHRWDYCEMLVFWGMSVRYQWNFKLCILKWKFTHSFAQLCSSGIGKIHFAAEFRWAPWWCSYIN